MSKFNDYAWSGGWVPRGDSTSRSCHCVGPRPGMPKCPCMMQNVKVRDGRYIQDLGPVQSITHEVVIPDIRQKSGDILELEQRIKSLEQAVHALETYEPPVTGKRNRFGFVEPL